MHFDDFDIDEVFSDYARIMQDGGHLEKKATYVVPKSLLGDSNYSEIDVNEELRKIAAENGGSKLYGLFSEDVMSGAHPEGSTKVADAPDGLGEVETLEAAQQKMKDVAEKKVKLAKLILSIAADLDASGFHAMAQELDLKTAEFLGKSIKVKKKASLPATVEQTLVDLSQMVAQALDKIKTPYMREQYKNSLDKHFSDAVTSELAAKQLPKVFYQYLKHLASLPDERAAAEALGQLADAIYSIPRVIDEAKNMATEEAGPGESVEQGVAKTLTNEDKMKLVQQKLNKMFPDAGLDENGNKADKRTWSVVRNKLNLVPGQDFKNYDQLLAKL